jgi:hypothetical protein
VLIRACRPLLGVHGGRTHHNLSGLVGMFTR